MGNDYEWYDGRYHASLSTTNLFGAILNGADLSNSIIINPISFQSLKGDNRTDFSRSITTSSLFIDQVNQFTNNQPEIITSIEQLRSWLERIDEYFDKKLMEALSKICNFNKPA